MPVNRRRLFALLSVAAVALALAAIVASSWAVIERARADISNLNQLNEEIYTPAELAGVHLDREEILMLSFKWRERTGPVHYEAYWGLRRMQPVTMRLTP